MANSQYTTLQRISEQIIRIFKRGDDNASSDIKLNEIKVLVVQALADLLKIDRGNELKSGEGIGISISEHAIATYSGVEVKTDLDNDEDYSELPAYPIRLPLSAGVWEVSANANYKGSVDARQVVAWDDLTNVTEVSNHQAQKNVDTAAWDSGAFSTSSIAELKDGFLEILAGEENVTKAFGLSEDDESVSYDTIEYCIVLTDTDATVPPFVADVNRVHIYESGTFIGDFGSYISTDVFRIERMGTSIVYKKNGETLYVSVEPSETELFADVSIYTFEASIFSAILYTKGGIKPFDLQFIPVPAAAKGIISSLPVGALEQKVGYEVDGNKIRYLKRISTLTPAVDKVNIKLIIVDPNLLKEYDPLPVSQDQERKLIELVLGMLKYAPPVQDKSQDNRDQK